MGLRERIAQFIAYRRMPQWERNQDADSKFYIQSAELAKGLFQRATENLPEQDQFDLFYIFLTLALIHNADRISMSSGSKETKERRALSGEAMRKNLITKAFLKSPDEEVAGLTDGTLLQQYDARAKEAAALVFNARRLPARQLQERMKIELPKRLTMMQQIRTGQRVSA